MQGSWRPQTQAAGGRRCCPGPPCCPLPSVPPPTLWSPPRHPPCWRKPCPQAASCPQGCSGGVIYCEPGVLQPPQPVHGVLGLSQPRSPHLSSFLLQTPGAQRHQVHPPRRLLPLQEAAEDVSVAPNHPAPRTPQATAERTPAGGWGCGVKEKWGEATLSLWVSET